MPESPIHTAVIIGSNRDGRFGHHIGRWFVGHAEQRDDVVLDVIDLATVRLPDALPRELDATARDYVARIARADAFVVVTPEYNHGYPASLKQAIDLPHREWQAKPVAFVSYGGLAGGLRAVEQLRQVFAELHAVTVRDTVSFHNFFHLFDDEGEPIDPTASNAAAKNMLDQLTWWAAALRTARSTHPYAA